MNIDKGYSSFVLKLMLVCTILILGSSIIFSFNSGYKMLNLNGSENNSSNDSNKLIDTLYSYVTYGRDLEPMYYFLKYKELTNDNFDELEKAKYAFQFVTEDDIFDKTDSSFKIAGNKYRSFIKEIFGESSEYVTDTSFVLYINKIFQNSIVNISYNQTQDYFLVERINGYSKDNNLQMFYTYYDGYNVNNEEDLINISEKVIFTEPIYTKDLNKMDSLNVYKDIRHTKLLDKIDNPSNALIDNFSIDDYLDNANTITYTFKKGSNGKYYFYKSVMEL